ncbi:ATP-grasp domain-containing protein [Halalkalibacterium halodurans]|uniref:ATP-grasp domain-containing protein n=1 Tax=Halalkalibacterium halodurans TaxID=86665 RepID=UPI002E1D1C07|nr:ATP-grasp domain-containing protein [Halalkalibacterium halodurans]
MNILLIGAGSNRNLAINTFLENEDKLFIVDNVNSNYLKFAHEFSTVSDFRNYNEVYRVSLDLAIRNNIDAIITFSDPCLLVVGELSQQLRIPNLTPKCAAIAHNKDLMREEFLKAGLDIPLFKVINNEKELKSGLEVIKFPAIIKPSNRAGSIGVSKVNNLDESIIGFRNAWDGRLLGKGVVLLEEFIEGDEISVESVTKNGKTHIVAITKKIVSESGYFYEIGHCLPYDQYTDAQLVKEVVAKALQTINFTHGIAHSELIVTKEGVKIIEVNGRAAGDYIIDLIYYAKGLNMYQLLRDLYLDSEDLDGKYFSNVNNKYAAIQFFETPPGYLKEVKIPETDLEKKNIKDFSLYFTENEYLPPITSSIGRRGHVIATSESLDEVESTVEEIVQKLLFILEE